MNWPVDAPRINLVSPQSRETTAQAIKMLENTVSGLKTGIFRSTRIGDPLLPAFAAFVRSSRDAAAAWNALSLAAKCHWNRLDEISAFALETRFLHVVEMLEAATTVSLVNRQALRQELLLYLVSLRGVMDEEARALAKVGGGRAPVRRAGVDLADIEKRTVQAMVALEKTAGTSIARQKAALVQSAFMGRMRELETSGLVLSGTDRILLGAHKKFSSQVGSSRQAEWTRVWDFLTGNAKGAPSPEAIKAELREFDRLVEARAKSRDPDTQINLFKAGEAARKTPIHSNLKGKVLGEMFAQHWDDWSLHMDAYEHLANQAAEALGPGWKVRKVYGNMRLGSKEYLDQAILLVNEGLASDARSSVPLAKLFLGVQVKVENINTSLEQTLGDMLREVGHSTLEIERIGEPSTLFRLLPSLPGETAHRWVLNAAESDFPDSALKRVIESRVTLHQLAMPMTLEEFNLLAHALMRAAADAL